MKDKYTVKLEKQNYDIHEIKFYGGYALFSFLR